MELPGSEYLFTFSLVAITFTAVSVLVMLMRQSLGGKPSNFDIYLLTAHISFGFAHTLNGLWPALIAFAEIPLETNWAVSSVLAAILICWALARSLYLRKHASTDPMSYGVAGGFVVHGIMAGLLLANSLYWQNAVFYVGPVTISLGATMWLFTRRIASLFGEKPGDDWDPKRG
ncbi:MAG TPA: hypothetical protein VJS40_05090 [Aestuariivirgaceae bacterium]|nr:hypothetical protein [Aestuariivirgaceae bacterium]